MLGLLAAVVLGAVNNMLASQKRMQRRLACAEIANRLMLQYLDDKESMPAGAVPIPYAGDEFRWDMAQAAVDIVPARPDVAAERAAERRGLRLERIQSVVIRVWLAEESGGSPGFDEFVPYARIARLVDPIGRAMRNPDSAEYLLRDPNSARFQEFMSDLQRFGSGGGGRPATTPTRGTRPPQTPPGKPSS
jgi:hypothetical protein